MHNIMQAKVAESVSYQREKAVQNVIITHINLPDKLSKDLGGKQILTLNL